MVFETDSKVAAVKSFNTIPDLNFSMISATSPTPAFVITGIPIAIISPCFVGDDACFEYHGFIKKTENLLKESNSGTSDLFAFLMIILFASRPAFIAGSIILLSSSGEINRNFAEGIFSLIFL